MTFILFFHSYLIISLLSFSASAKIRHRSSSSSSSSYANKFHLLIPPLLLLPLNLPFSMPPAQPRSSPSTMAALFFRSSCVYLLHISVFISLWLLNSDISTSLTPSPTPCIACSHMPQSFVLLHEMVQCVILLFTAQSTLAPLLLLDIFFSCSISWYLSGI